MDKLLSINFHELSDPLTIYISRGVGSVVTKCLPAVSIFTLVVGAESQQETWGTILDQHNELLIHQHSGRLDWQLHATIISVHPELSIRTDRHEKTWNKPNLHDWKFTVGKRNICGIFNLQDVFHKICNLRYGTLNLIAISAISSAKLKVMNFNKIISEAVTNVLFAAFCTSHLMAEDIENINLTFSLRAKLHLSENVFAMSINRTYLT